MTMLALIAALCAADTPSRPVLCPPPKHVVWGEASGPAAGVRAGGGQSEQARYARDRLRRAVPERGGAGGVQAVVRLREAGSAEEVARAAGEAGLPAPPSEAFPESYVVAPGDTPGEFTITAGPAGLIYGADTLGQLWGGARLWNAAVSDWPTLRERAYTGCPRVMDEAGLGRLDWLATWRINALYYEIYGDQGEDSVPETVEALARECERRGIFLYGLISNWRTARLVKRPLCPAREEDLARVRRYSEELLDRGCRGLIFLFDDITQEQVDHPRDCELCRERYPTLAGGQLALMRPMLEVGRARGVERFIVCPTPYYAHWKKSYGDLDGCAYFGEWGAAEELARVGVYHCLVRRSRLQEVVDCGLRDYVYWFNGLRDFFADAPGGRGLAGTWGGLSDLAYSWYLSHWDGARGSVADEDAYDALRELPSLTRSAWLCGGGWFPWALWGAYLWDADRLDAGALRRATIGRCYGPEAAEAYLRWEDAARPALARMLTFHLSEALTRGPELVRGLQQAAEAARGAAGAFGEVVARRAEDGGPDPRGLVPPEEAEGVASRMSSTAETLAREAEGLAAGRCSVAIGATETTKLPEGAVRRETRVQLRRGLITYGLRYSQTEEPDGTRHRSQWHFGSGLGMTGPSYRNWYDAGFLDVVVNGRSLDAYTPAFSTVTHEGVERLQATWAADAAEVVLVLAPRLDGGLEIEGRLVSRREIAGVRLDLFAIPGAGEGDWEDMDKAVITPSGVFQHGEAVTLKDGERWLFFLDRAYDVPRERAEGPCAAVLVEPAGAEITTDNGSYVVTTRAELGAECRGFRVVVYDFHGMGNEQGLEYLRGRIADPAFPDTPGG